MQVIDSCGKALITGGAFMGAALFCSIASASDDDIERILVRFATDYARDVTFSENVTFGVRVGEDEWWTIDAQAAQQDGAEGYVTVAAGRPSQPTFFYTIDSKEFLMRIDRGDLNALTAMAKAYSSDVTPMDIDVMEGYEPDKNFTARVIPFTFHFWTRGMPEFIPYSGEKTRATHGANAGILYYQPGFRSGWFHIRPGQHVNEPEDQKTNPFPSMFIMVDGEVTAKIGDNEFLFTEGNAILVPAGVAHEFWNDGDAPGMGFLFMFGDGA